MSQIESEDDTFIFSCQPYEVGITAPYENIELLIKQGSYIKPKEAEQKDEHQ